MHVLILTNSQRVSEDLDAEVKKLGRILEGKHTELAEAVKRFENQAGNFRNELRGSQAEVMEPKLKGNITDLQNYDRKKVATALVKMFSDQAKQAKTQGALSLLSGQTTNTIGLSLGLRVEYALYDNSRGQSEEPSERYIDMFRAIQHNVKANPELRDRLLDGSLSPNSLSKMSRASMESKAAVIKEVEKQHVHTQEFHRAKDLIAGHAKLVQVSRRLKDTLLAHDAIQAELARYKSHAEYQLAHYSNVSKRHQAKLREQKEEIYR